MLKVLEPILNNYIREEHGLSAVNQVLKLKHEHICKHKGQSCMTKREGREDEGK
jgi:hypothetical protein